MGIGNDIKPKKVYRYKPPEHQKAFRRHPQEEDEKEEIEPKEFKRERSEPEDYDPKKVEEIEDDFFHDYNKKAPKKQKKEEGSDGFLFQNLSAKNITWLLVITLIVIVIYQNFDSIKGLVIKEDATNRNTNLSNEYYEGVSSNSNSNSANINSNTNTNLNVNANTNTAVVTPSVDKTTIKVKALNGNGVAGSADAVAATLKTAGFLPGTSGNASKFTYATSIVYYKTGEEASANLVKAALPNLSTTLTLSDSITGTYDVVVVVGKK